MSYGNGLAFSTLSEYNFDRVNCFGHGGLAGWNIAEWSNAIAGETGELCNITKKILRGDYGPEVLKELSKGFEDVKPGFRDYRPASYETIKNTIIARQHIADELADIVTYCDLLAQKCGIDLGRAVLEKFNRVSTRVGYEGLMRAE